MSCATSFADLNPPFQHFIIISPSTMFLISGYLPSWIHRATIHSSTWPWGCEDVMISKIVEPRAWSSARIVECSTSLSSGCRYPDWAQTVEGLSSIAEPAKSHSRTVLDESNSTFLPLRSACLTLCSWMYWRAFATSRDHLMHSPTVAVPPFA